MTIQKSCAINDFITILPKSAELTIRSHRKEGLLEDWKT